MEELPKDVRKDILSRLNMKDLSNLKLVNKTISNEVDEIIAERKKKIDKIFSSYKNDDLLFKLDVFLGNYSSSLHSFYVKTMLSLRSKYINDSDFVGYLTKLSANMSQTEKTKIIGDLVKETCTIVIKRGLLNYTYEELDKCEKKLFE